MLQVAARAGRAATLERGISLSSRDHSRVSPFLWGGGGGVNAQIRLSSLPLRGFIVGFASPPERRKTYRRSHGRNAWKKATAERSTAERSTAERSTADQRRPKDR